MFESFTETIRILGIKHSEEWKNGIYTMASYLEKYQVLDELKKIDKFKSEGKI